MHGLLVGALALLAVFASIAAAMWLADVWAGLTVQMLEQTYRLPGSRF